jgi:hypothetical protein
MDYVPTGAYSARPVHIPLEIARIKNKMRVFLHPKLNLLRAIMSQSLFRLLARVLFPVCVTAWVNCTAWGAQTVQTLNLAHGWNAVWLEVTPEDSNGLPKTCDQVFQSNDFLIDRVASPVGQIGVAEFTSDPESLFNQGGWEVWAADPQSGETASIAIRANHAYLVHVSPKTGSAQDGSSAGTLDVQGSVVFYQPAWIKGDYNLVGFGVQGAPTFASLMAGSGIIVDGPTGTAANVQKLNPATGSWEPVKGSDSVESGKAYWVNVPYTLFGEGWAGPVGVSFSGAVSGSMAFGSGPGSLQVVNPANPVGDPVPMSATELTFSSLEASGGPQHQVTLTRLSPTNSDPAASDLQFFALQPVPLELKWQTQSVDFLTGWQAASVNPASSITVTVGVKRNWSSGVSQREHLYRLSVSLSGGSVCRYLPVSATQADLPTASGSTPPASQFTGLWAGQIILNSVTSLATEGSPMQATASELPMQIFIHVDSAGQARLVPRSILMQTKTTSPDIAPTQVLVVDETRIPYLDGVQQRADGTRVGLRLETVTFDLPRDLSAAHLSASLRSKVATAQGIANPASVTDADVSAYFPLATITSRPPDLPETYYLTWPLDGQLGVGRTLGTGGSSPLTLDTFHRSNPFRHAFHPQHGVGYPVTRSFSITFNAAPDPTILTGTYQETTRGLARQDIVSKGGISLRRITTADTLQ